MSSAGAVAAMRSVARQGSEIHIALTGAGNGPKKLASVTWNLAHLTGAGHNPTLLTTVGHNLQQLKGRGLNLSEYQIVQ